MRHLVIKRVALLLFIINIFSLTLGVSVSAECADPVCKNQAASSSESDGVKVSSRIYELLFKGRKKNEEIYLIPGGDVFGIRIKEHGVTVTAAPDDSPLKRGDKILTVNDVEIKEAAKISELMSEHRGGAVKIGILRCGERMTVTVVPKLTDGTYKLGITLKNAALGIGTVTFIDPETKVFGGLGHGVSNPEGGETVELASGEATGVVLGGITRGECGKPGELSGILSRRKLGSIDINCECGVFGSLTELTSDAQPLPIGHREELKVGEAEIISTVKSGKKSTYKIEITDIDTTSTGSKSFKIHVTDPMLITLTGGIVRGMSGSPIIQDGKIVGAVTHVMVANPTEGYGIFIENMLNAANQQAQPKAA